MPWRKLSLSLSAVVGLLLLGEALVRVRQYVRHGTFGRVHVLVEAEGGLWLPPAGRVTSGVRINSKSFRGPEIEEPKPPGRIRLAFLGGSTTFCAEATRNEATWPALVTARLAQLHPQLEFDYVNAGIPGYTTETSLKNLVQRVKPLDPDVLVIYHASNDITFDTRLAAQGQGVYDGHADRDSWLSRLSLGWYLIEKNLLYKSRAAQVKRTAGRLRLDEELSQHFRERLEELIREGLSVASVVAVPTFSISARREHAPERQFEALRGAFYYMPYMTVDSVLDAFDEYNRAIREVATSTGALLIEAAEQIPADGKHFTDAVHFTNRGCKVMAELVLRALTESEDFQDMIDASSIAPVR